MGYLDGGMGTEEIEGMELSEDASRKEDGLLDPIVGETIDWGGLSAEMGEAGISMSGGLPERWRWCCGCCCWGLLFAAAAAAS